MQHLYAILFSVIVGYGYYQMMEASIPNESNCSYLATKMTDYLAFLYGFIVMGYAFKYDNVILTILGGTIIVEHIFQLKRKI